MASDEKLLGFGFQYYIVARCGVRAHLLPVTGNLFHHAIEMFLKARLSQSMSSKEMKKQFSHRMETTPSVRPTEGSPRRLER